MGSTSNLAWCLTPSSLLPRTSRTRRRPRTSLCASPPEEAPTIPANSKVESVPSNAQFGLLTDSILELKWKNEQSSPKKTSAPVAPPPHTCRPCSTIAHPDDLVASDPYKAFAHFTRLAAPTAALGRNDAPLAPELSLHHNRDSPYSAASIAHRLMRYTYARKNLDEFLTLFQGEFDNYDQIASERREGMLPGEGGGHEHIHCSVRQISSDLLFARYYFNGDPSTVFRSRLYRVDVNDASERGIVEMRIFRFYEETEQMLKANNYDITAIEWDDDDVYDWLAGCEVYWEHYSPSDDDEAGRMLGIERGARFVGYMKGGGCEFFSREIGGCIRVMDDLLLTSEELWVADRGFDEEDNFVYGNRRGVPYKMRRVRHGSRNDWTLDATRSPPEGRSSLTSQSNSPPTICPPRPPSNRPTMVIQEVEHGGRFISTDALEKARKGNKFEKVKLHKDGSAMWTEIHELSALLRAGETTWEDLDADDIDIRLKWAGLFHRRKRTPGRFMMRLKLPNGILNSQQLRYFASVLRPYGTDGCADITTRMNIQLRGITLDDAASVCQGLYDIGLTSFMSGMDNVRNMVGSPIAGIDPLEMVDTRQLCTQINDMITDNRKGRAELANLPRKFNICVSGGRDDFAHTHINDIGLVPMKHKQTGEIGFNVVIGGFFSIKRNAEAIPMDVWLKQDDVVKFCETVLLWFRDNGDRGRNRQATRLMYMVDKLTMEGFREEIEKAFGSPLEQAMDGGDEYATPFERRNVLGIHPQKQPGLSWVAACVPAGRFSTEDFDVLADVADKYSDGELRLTVEQNILFPNVANERVEELCKDPIFEKFQIRPGKISGGLVSCTGAQFCGIALIETKNRAIALAEELDRTLDVPRDVRLHWTGCPNSCGQVQVADIGLMGTAVRKNGKGVEGVKIFVGGKIGESAELGEMVNKGVPTDFEDLLPAVTEILVERFGATVKA